MIVNIHPAERSARIIIGFFVFAIAYTQISAWMALGAVLFVAGMTGFCPLYRLIGFSTERVAATLSMGTATQEVR